MSVSRLALGLFLLAPALAAQTTGDSGRPTYDVHAVRYATLPAFPVSGLVAGADASRRLDIAMSVWMLRGAGRTVLVDAGFHRQRFIDRWKPRDFISPAEAVRRAGVAPEAVTDIVVTHVHWDHADGIDLFPNATVWIQAEEYRHYVAPDGTRRDQIIIEPEVAALLHSLDRAGRLRLIDGDAQEFLPGLTAYTGGRHTHASQFVGVRSAAGTVIIASDNMYLYENLDRRVPIAQTFDAASNLRAQDRMRQLAGDLKLIVPGHDPETFVRFATPGNGVAHIRD
jgi:glyoxylase-like metal-dependent hydrolase (beta-lactamase superfamily II)